MNTVDHRILQLPFHRHCIRCRVRGNKGSSWAGQSNVRGGSYRRAHAASYTDTSRRTHSRVTPLNLTWKNERAAIRMGENILGKQKPGRHRNNKNDMGCDRREVCGETHPNELTTRWSILRSDSATCSEHAALMNVASDTVSNEELTIIS